MDGNTRRAAVRRRLMGGLRDQKGGVIALVALFLPVAVLCLGMVADLGMVFVARKAVQAACDFGALAGVLELDWDKLAAGEVRIREQDGKSVSAGIARQNLQSVASLVEVVSVTSSVVNPPARPDPVVVVEVRFTARTLYLHWVPGLEAGFQGRALSEASVVKRTQW